MSETLFTATATVFDISGTVKDGNGQPIAGVAVTFGGSAEAEASTDANGRYAFANLPANGSYTVSPSPDGNVYTPASKNIDALQADLTEVDFILVVPTAASVSITGRVTTANGQGISNALLTLTLPDGAQRTATTSTFGYYRFEGVEVGHVYILKAASQRYAFANATRIFTLQEEVTGMDFTAMPE